MQPQPRAGMVPFPFLHHGIPVRPPMVTGYEQMSQSIPASLSISQPQFLTQPSPPMGTAKRQSKSNIEQAVRRGLKRAADSMLECVKQALADAIGPVPSKEQHEDGSESLDLLTKEADLLAASLNEQSKTLREAVESLEHIAGERDQAALQLEKSVDTMVPPSRSGPSLEVAEMLKEVRDLAHKKVGSLQTVTRAMQRLSGLGYFTKFTLDRVEAVYAGRGKGH